MSIIEILKKDRLLSGLVVTLNILWVGVMIFPRKPLASPTVTEQVIYYPFMFAFGIGGTLLFLTMEKNAGRIEWRGCESEESRAAVSKAIVRGALLMCIGLIIFDLLRR